MSRPLVPPIVLSSTFAFPTNDALAAAVRDHDAFLYARWSNPTVDAVEREIAVLEGAERSILVGSGMAAVHLALLAALGDGVGPIAVQREVYGGTHELVEAVRWPTGVTVLRPGLDELNAVAQELPPRAVLFVETPTNPLIRLVDLRALRAACGPGVVIVVDATFASPALWRALDDGADLVLHSATKALGGHHDLVAGVISGNGPLMDAVWRWRKILGPTLDPGAAYRLWRGLQTLSLRVERQSRTAAALASLLREHAAVVSVFHPSLPDHPDHALLLSRFTDGLAGGVLAFDVGSAGRAAAVVDALQHVAVAPSLGGTHTLVSWSAGVTHANVSESAQRAAGLSPGLLRLAVGLEPVKTLWDDLRAALDRGLMGAARP